MFSMFSETFHLQFSSFDNVWTASAHWKKSDQQEPKKEKLIAATSYFPNLNYIKLKVTKNQIETCI